MSLFILLVFNSCKKSKDEIIKESKTKQLPPIEPNSSLPSITLYDYTADLQQIINNVSCSGNTISLINSAKLELTVQELEDVLENWNNSFEANFPNGMGHEELDEMDEKYGFDEEQPLKDFEAAFPCYTSLRSKIETEEENWLEQSGENFDPNADPTDSYSTIDEVLQTLLNAEQKITINNQLEDLSSSFNPNTDFERGGNCVAYKRKKGWFEPLAPERKLKMILSIEGNTPWGSGVNAKSKSYKKRGNRYFKARFDIGVSWDGTSKIRSGEDCDILAPLTANSKFKKRKKVKITYRNWGSFIRIEKRTSGAGASGFDLRSTHHHANYSAYLYL